MGGAVGHLCMMHDVRCMLRVFSRKVVGGGWLFSVSVDALSLVLGRMCVWHLEVHRYVIRLEEITIRETEIWKK